MNTAPYSHELHLLAILRNASPPERVALDLFRLRMFSSPLFMNFMMVDPSLLFRGLKLVARQLILVHHSPSLVDIALSPSFVAFFVVLFSTNSFRS